MTWRKIAKEFYLTWSTKILDGYVVFLKNKQEKQYSSMNSSEEGISVFKHDKGENGTSLTTWK